MIIYKKKEMRSGNLVQLDVVARLFRNIIQKVTLGDV